MKLTASQKFEKEEKSLRNKLARAIHQMGLSWAAWSSLVDIADNVYGRPNPTAMWVLHLKSKKEHIVISRRLMRDLPTRLIALVLKHEFLHKAMYRNVARVANKPIINFVLDAAVNKILFLSHPRHMVELCHYLFPKGHAKRLDIECVMNCSLTTDERNKLSPGLRQIYDDLYLLTKKHRKYNTDTYSYDEWESIHTCGEVVLSKHVQLNTHVPDPLMLYSKLSILLNKKEKKKVEDLYDYLKSPAKGEEDNGPPKPGNSDDKEYEKDKNDEEDNSPDESTGSDESKNDESDESDDSNSDDEGTSGKSSDNEDSEDTDSRGESDSSSECDEDDSDTDSNGAGDSDEEDEEEGDDEEGDEEDESDEDESSEDESEESEEDEEDEEDVDEESEEDEDDSDDSLEEDDSEDEFDDESEDESDNFDESEEDGDDEADPQEPATPSPGDIDVDELEVEEGQDPGTGEGEEKPDDPIAIRGGEDGQRANDKESLRNEEGAAHKITYAAYSTYNNLKAYFEKYVYALAHGDTEGLEDFVRRFNTEKQIEGVTETIYQNIRVLPSIDPFPINLSRTGFELVALDVCGPDEIPLYFNNGRGSGKKKICCYFDTSPSMHEYIPHMLSIVNFFNSCDECEIAGGAFEGKYAFSEKVMGITPDDWKAFLDGTIRGGSGTSFENVTQHAIAQVDENEVDVIVIFTDGFSGVNQATIDRFNASGKTCYRIYFTGNALPYYHTRHKWGMPGFTAKDILTSDLDKLNGESFTIFCGELQTK